MVAQESESGQQTLPVSQNQIRQREYHMQFGQLFSSALVSRLAITELSFHHTENMLDLSPHG